MPLVLTTIKQAFSVELLSGVPPPRTPPKSANKAPEPKSSPLESFAEFLASGKADIVKAGGRKGTKRGMLHVADHYSNLTQLCTL